MSASGLPLFFREYVGYRGISRMWSMRPILQRRRAMSWEVTELQPQKRKRNRFNIITDEGYLLSLSAETIVKAPYPGGMIALEEELLEKLRQGGYPQICQGAGGGLSGYAPPDALQVQPSSAQGIDAESAEAALCHHGGIRLYRRRGLAPGSSPGATAPSWERRRSGVS